jgi:hypothetical protein
MGWNRVWRTRTHVYKHKIYELVAVRTPANFDGLHARETANYTPVLFAVEIFSIKYLITPYII